MTINRGASSCACTKMSMKKIIRFLLIRSDIFVAAILGRIVRTQLQAIERALAGQAVAAISHVSPLLPLWISLADGCGQERIPPRQIVIIEVFVSERQPVNSLGDQIFHTVLDLIRVSVISEAGRKLLDDLPLRLDLFEQQHAAIGGDRASIELGHHLPRSAGLKLELFISTLCLHLFVSFLWE